MNNLLVITLLVLTVPVHQRCVQVSVLYALSSTPEIGMNLTSPSRQTLSCVSSLAARDGLTAALSQ